MINKLVKHILENYWDGKLPIDVDTIARRIGVKVEYVTDYPDVSGIFSIVNGVPTCAINAFEPLLRQRFTLAHELGHFALKHHGESFRDPLNIFNSVMPKEREANRFAAELLMPGYLVNGLIHDAEMVTVDALADRFAVSKPAMRIRLKELGWI